MDKCIYNNKPLYAFDIFDEYKNVIVPKEEEYRKLSKENKLSCNDCGREVVFKFGPVKGAYFAHKHDIFGESCDYKPESEEHRNAKILLYRKISKDLPNCEAEIRYKLPSRKVADIFVKLHTGQEFIIEFVKSITAYSTLTDKFNYYRDNNITAIWILSSKNIDLNTVYNERSLYFSFRKLDNESDYVIYFDVDTHEFSFVKKLFIISPYTNEVICSEIISKCYKEDKCFFTPSGELFSPFKNYIETVKTEILEKDKQAYLKKEEEKKAIEEANKLAEEKRKAIETAARLEEEKRKALEEKEKLEAEIRKSKKLQEAPYKSVEQDSFFGTTTVIETKSKGIESEKVNQTSLFDSKPISAESYFQNKHKESKQNIPSKQSGYTVGNKSYMNKYFTRVNMAINGDMQAFNLLKKSIEIYGSSDSIKEICSSFDYFIDRNYSNAKVLKEKLLIETEFGNYI